MPTKEKKLIRLILENHRIVGPKETKTGDTLCDEDHPLLLEQIVFLNSHLFGYRTKN
jgi:hypothetical protein